MEPSAFDETAFFRALSGSGVRALLIGRRALVLLGLPVLTADYDLWIAADEAARLNDLAAAFGLHPTHEPAAARRRGRYARENDERIDVLLARSVSTVDGETVRFDELWERRRRIPLGEGVDVAIPCIEDLIRTKKFRARPKDLEDIRLLEILRTEKEGLP